jgi:GTP-binding protein
MSATKQGKCQPWAAFKPSQGGISEISFGKNKIDSFKSENVYEKCSESCPMKSATILHTISSPDQFSTDFEGTIFRGRSEPRVAFIGRSNVGKSSLINRLLKEKVAQVSSSPGKTKALHFYDWKLGKKIFVDLPGYGFAAESKDSREYWKKLISRYLKEDLGLGHLVVLIDSRHGPLEKDIEALDFFLSSGCSVVIVATKSDQLKNQSARHQSEKLLDESLKPFAAGITARFLVSVEDERSIQKLRMFLRDDVAESF